MLSLNFLDKKDLVLMKFLVQRELSSLSECLGAAFVWAFKWLLTCVNVHVFFQVLPQSEILPTSQACVLLGRCVSRFVASE